MTDQMKTHLVDDLLNSLSGLSADTRDILRIKFEKLIADQGLVTREAFDIQQQVLQRTRAKLEQLEKTVKALETEKMTVKNSS